MPQPPVILSDMLSGFELVQHGFFTAQGGVSTGLYSSLNCSAYSDDDQSAVAENRSLVAQSLKLKPNKLVSLRQIHSNNVYYVQDASEFTSGQMQSGDGLVTDQPGIGLGVMGADCAPVLFADANAGVIGAAHAGWKGALNGICDAVVKAMCERGATRSNICAAIGPAMQEKHYEVQDDFYQMISDQSPIPADGYFYRQVASSALSEGEPQKPYMTFDTPAYVEARLKALGLMQIDRSREDTFSQPERFFSFRRSVQLGLSDYGRQIAVISLSDADVQNGIDSVK